jgi:hypothetical protein
MLRNGETGENTTCYVVIAAPRLHDIVFRVIWGLQTGDPNRLPIRVMALVSLAGFNPYGSELLIMVLVFMSLLP